MIGGVLYTTTGASEVAAVDAATGQTKWLFTPLPRPGTESEPGKQPQESGRGVAYWTDGQHARIFHNVSDGRLVALDAETGQPVTEFGDRGYVDLSKDIDRPGAQVRCISTPIVSNDVVVAQVIPTGDSGYNATPGHIRGYDVRTGERLWIFHVVPQADDFGVDTWEDESWRYTGHAGVWTQLTVDEELGYIYLPTEIATNDWYGGHRPGDNLFAESLVCLDVRTGERVWHYQLIHHGIWDYDNPAPPTLLDVTHDGRRVKAVAIVTKQGYTYVFDREPWDAALADHRNASPAIGRSRREDIPYPTDPVEACSVRAAGVQRRQPDRLHSGAARRSHGDRLWLSHGPTVFTPFPHRRSRWNTGPTRASGLGWRCQLAGRRCRRRDWCTLRSIPDAADRDRPEQGRPRRHQSGLHSRRTRLSPRSARVAAGQAAMGPHHRNRSQHW